MKSTYCPFLHRFILISLLMVTFITSAQELTFKEVKERKKQVEQALKDAQQNKQGNHYIGETPLSTMVAIIEEIANDDFAKVVEYFDFRFLEQEQSLEQKEKTIRQLIVVWSKHHTLDFSLLSEEPEGHLNDGLSVDRDLLGVIKSQFQDVPIYLQRVRDANGNRVWKISSNAIANVPLLWQEFGYPPYIQKLEHYLPEFHVLDMQNWQFVCFVFIVIFAWFASALVRSFLIKIVSVSETYSRTMRRFIRVPLRFFLFLTLIPWAASFLGLSVNARAWLDSGILSYLATIFISIGAIEFSFALYVSRSKQDNNIIILLKPMVTTLKIITVIVIILNWFHDAGFNITAIITGLGIGSLAVALAAQKSLENVFGAFTLFFARPIKPGDMCKFGNTQGRVEEIGLRSTKIRKLDRKVVHVPNSTIASMDLENITEIDNRRYLKHFRIRLTTSIGNLRALVQSIRTLIDGHPQTIPLERYVRFEHVDEDAFIIVVNTYVTTSGRVKYKEIEERLNFEIMQIIDDMNIELAIPEQNISLIQSTDESISKEQI